MRICALRKSPIFQSTSSARRTTPNPSYHPRPERNFNPRPPRGGRHYLCCPICGQECISIHVLREEDDRPRSWRWLTKSNFNPRPPRGGRPMPKGDTTVIAIFQSTSSARRTTESTPIARRTNLRFQSTSSARRTTTPPTDRIQYRIISIHVLREEDDLFW